MRRWKTVAATWLAAGSSPLFAAGGSFLVDDATVTPDGHCQLESWVRAIERTEGDFTTTPACTVESVELSVSADRRAGGGASATTFGVGAKWVAGDLDKEGRAIGIAAGALWSDGAFVSEALYVPASVTFGADHSWTMHFNAGGRHTAGDGWHAISGVGVETPLTDQWVFMAEFFDAAAAEKTVQIGARWSVTPTADIDVVLGHSKDAVDESWLTLGLNLAF